LTGEGRCIGYEFTCRKCGDTEFLKQNGHTRRPPPEAIERWAANKGWSLGHNPNQDVCPECMKPKRRPRLTVVRPDPIIAVVAKEGAQMNKQLNPSLVDTTERQMSREDRRLIFSKLEEVYLDETRGYASGWGDQKVADHFGVPRAWIVTMRDENFGPARGNEDLAALMPALESARKATAEARELVIDSQQKAAKAVRKADAASSALGKIEVELSRLERRINEVKQAVS
jgi:hypothetical protein